MRRTNQTEKQTAVKNKKIPLTRENLDNFKITRTKCKRTIRETKKKSWIIFTSTINVNTSIATVCQNLYFF